MKGIALFIAIFALMLLMIPMIAMSFDSESPGGVQPAGQAPGQPAWMPREQPPVIVDEQDTVEAYAGAPWMETEPESTSLIGASRHGVQSFRILNQSTGEVETVSVRDYVRGAVAAEMPASFHPEAMKAQAVAAHTYALHHHYVQMSNPDPALKGADFAADPDNMLGYITEAKAREFYGANADLYWNKVCQAADSVLEYLLEYDDVPIVAAYHAISAGWTEDASNVWIGSAPYLLPAQSGGDLLAPNFESHVDFTPNELSRRIAAKYPDADFSDEPHLWFDNFVRSDSGYVTEVWVGGQPMHGKEVRELLGLRSHNFEVQYLPSGRFQFTVFGYGHGVGLSQYGADFMARQGYTFDEILRQYYTGVSLSRVEISVS